MSEFPIDLIELSRTLQELATEIQADGVTCWLAKSGELVAIANPLEPAIVGISQALQKGIISQVFATGQAILETDPTNHHAHDPSVDQALATHCQTLMAAPWGNDSTEGILSAVQHAGSGKSFSLQSLQSLSQAARQLTSLLPTAE